MSPPSKLPPKLEPLPMPWEQQPGEGDEAYAAFHTYKSLGKDRSARKVCESVGKSESLIWRWKSKFNWTERARLWDRQLDEDFKQGLVAERVRSARETIELGRAIRGKAAEALNEMIDKKKVIEKKDILTWAELGVKIERLGLGDSNINIKLEESRTNGMDIEAIIRNPRALRAALELDDALSEGEPESVGIDDAGEPDVAESETPQTPEQ